MATNNNQKHPNYNNELLPEKTDLFTPEFKRDTRGRYLMQLPGYGKWMVGVEPGSKIIAQGSEGEDGGPATDPGSIRTGSLHAETVITIGDKIYMDGKGCIHVGDYEKRVGPSISICGDGIKGYSGKDVVFAFFLAQDGDWGIGDVLIGDYASDEYLLWDDSDGKLYIKGDLIIQGDIESANYVAGSSGYKLTYLTGSAEFQDVIVRGQVIMEAGSSGDADYIDESAGRKWAAESGADITGGHTSNDTAYVAGSTAASVASGAERGLNAINASYRYQTWLTSSDMTASGISSGPAVVMDSAGIYGWNSSGDNTFQINSSTGDALLRGTIYASAGLISEWTIDTDRIWKQVSSGGNYTKVELNARDSGGAWPHVQIFSDTNSSYSSPDGIQMTSGDPASPVPRMDIYNAGTKRVMLNKDGLYFFASDGVTITSQILSGNGDGDVTFGGGVVRCWSNGVRVSEGNTFAAQASSTTYMQLYGNDDGILEIPSNSYGFKIMDATSSNNICRWTTGYMTLGSGAYSPDLIPSNNLSQDLGSGTNHWLTTYTANISYPGTIDVWMTNSFVVRESGSAVWSMYINGTDSYMGAGQNDAKLHANNNFTVETDAGNIYLLGAVSKTSGTFTIDHPLKPDTHFLQHSFVESPEMMNLYRGRGIIAKGRCTIYMPEWFIELNGEDTDEYSYQLTSIGQQNDLWVETEMNISGAVEFGGDKDGSFDFLITAVRHDPWAEAHRVEVEPTKASRGYEGKYIFKEFYADIRSFSSEARLISQDVGI